MSLTPGSPDAALDSRPRSRSASRSGRARQAAVETPNRLPVTAITLVLAATAMAFGAVYPWAFAPMGIAVLAIAIWQWRPTWPRGTVSWSVVLVMAAIALQLLPLSTSLVDRLSPGARGVLSTLDVAFANGMVSRHALSVHPTETARTLLFVLIAVLWTTACVSILNRPSTARVLVRNIALVGTVIAVVGLAQKATFNGKVLWFWTPQFLATNSFGPFINRNHFAGWMLLALALCLGLACGYVQRAAQIPARDLRDRLLWLGSPAASPLLLTAAAAIVMTCALLWTMSRSGIAAGGFIVAVMVAMSVRGMGGRLQRWMLVSAALGVVMMVVAWRGADTLAGWYGNTQTLEWRIDLWKDSMPALQQFWLTGSGLSSYSTLMLVFPRTNLDVHPNAAHNDYLQLAIEGGLLVGVPVLILAGVLVRRVVQRLRASQDEMTWWLRVGAVAGIVGMAIQETTEFSLQIPAIALLFGTCLAIALHEPVTPSSKPSR